MDLDEALARTITLLERQGFATYRTLKRRLHVDDATLAALKTALVDTQHLATEEGGTRLDVHFINSLPVKQRPACTVWADKRPAQIV